jgi:hypothetical protein
VSPSLHWKPVPKPPEDNDIDYDLALKLRKRIWEGNGTSFSIPVEVGEEIIPYLHGLMDCNVDGAAELIAEIREHGAIILYMTF